MPDCSLNAVPSWEAVDCLLLHAPSSAACSALILVKWHLHRLLPFCSHWSVCSHWSALTGLQPAFLVNLGHGSISHAC